MNLETNCIRVLKLRLYNPGERMIAHIIYQTELIASDIRARIVCALEIAYFLM